MNFGYFHNLLKRKFSQVQRSKIADFLGFFLEERQRHALNMRDVISKCDYHPKPSSSFYRLAAPSTPVCSAELWPLTLRYAQCTSHLGHASSGL